MAVKPGSLILLGVGLWGLYYLGREGNFKHTQAALTADPRAYTLGNWCGTQWNQKTVSDTPSIAAGEPEPGKIGTPVKTRNVDTWMNKWHRKPIQFGGAYR